ncbi:MAG: nuclear transport factor 2 family protein [Salinirussus sp.]
MDARETVEAYYTALRAGDPLGEFFADPRPGDDAPVKVGISERLVGADAIRAGLRQQTATTRNWTVRSRELRVCDRDDIAWFTDAVDLSWTDDERDERLTFDTRWSGVLEQRDRWQFVGMHVSAPREL